ncbi:MAG: 7,8-dihydropterin-6-yl-methyl-4-(beta-D-ribofuranosyl)aminobenzene 5'-phosphate synthase [Glaciecola sp.]|jgi:7,8-dihydropterin-6-yl-methyl-4-(beta-D-ribofuranosyl)aminobenzene 5'-phosphate synthase
MKSSNYLMIMTLVFVLIVLSLGVYRAITFKLGSDDVEQEWAAYKADPITNFGSTKSLSILPLVNWHTSDDSLKSEAGVSYLIKTDNKTILFDVGFNQNSESPSPLEHNMKQLGVTLENIDTIFMSHAHLDHSGGQQWVNKNTFSIGLEQLDLSDKDIYAAAHTTYPNSTVNIIPDATVIAPGIASLGAISRQLLLGRIEEQALVINVEGKGLVIVVGCGHQTVPKILTRAQQVFSENIYGLVGDLHYPIPEGRLNLLGINLQRYFASGEGPHIPITFETMDEELNLLKNTGLSLIALGGHDTSDEVIEHFNSNFGDSYRHVKVGDWIRVAK